MNVASAEAEVPHAKREVSLLTGATFSWKQGLVWVLASAASFHLAFAVPALSCAILVYAVGLIALSNAPRPRLAFRYGFAVGMLTFTPQLFWFWNIFGIVAVCLWAVLSFFSGLFVCGVHTWKARFGGKGLFLVAAALWTGLEYFRSEVYFLRFSWLNVGSAFSERIGAIPGGTLGTYGLGFVVFALAGIVWTLSGRRRALSLALACGVIAGLVHYPVPELPVKGDRVRVAGIQLEFPPDLKIPEYLDRVLEKEPDAQILVLSEYTIDSGVSDRLRNWCRENKRYLILGGKDEVGTNYFNTAFVVGPTGEVVFKQAKSVPIQFFKDGLPALSRRIWESPWGRIAICVCYDLSYRRVTDDFAWQGAKAIIVPFMDLTDWGGHQHRLHARVAPVRSREYGVPVFRLGSSGISQNVDAFGRVSATASFPGQEEVFAGDLVIAGEARLPLDAWLAPVCVWLVPFVFLAPFLRRDSLRFGANPS
jgi:apolipoprotein N-acyltransferase